MNAPQPRPGPEAFALLDEARLGGDRCEVHHEPFAFLIARDQLPPEAQSELARDFPRYAGAGFFPAYRAPIRRVASGAGCSRG